MQIHSRAKFYIIVGLVLYHLKQRRRKHVQYFCYFNVMLFFVLKISPLRWTCPHSSITTHLFTADQNMIFIYNNQS